MYLAVGIAAFVVFVIRFIQKGNPFPVFGIYGQPARWYFLKLSFIYFTLKARKVLARWQNQNKTRDSSMSGYGFKSRASVEDMDRIQPLSEHPKAIDAVYFNCANRDGYHLVVGTARRPKGVINGFMYFKVPEIGILETPKLPDTLMFNLVMDGFNYSAEGIELKPVKAMKKWKLEYKGKMKLHGDSVEFLDVFLELEFTSSLPYFDFDTNMDEMAVARGMAQQPWNREFFEALRSFHQTHYEQHGVLKGQVTMNDRRYPLELDGFRDHSYGEKREWRHFHRYALHFITLENGAKMNIGVVCVPHVFSRMEIGYLYKPDGSLHALQWCNLKLEHHGENGTPPTDYGFSFQAGEETFHVQVKVTDSPEFFVGWAWEARVVERLASFTVSGVNGWGAAEWEYCHLGGRPAEVATQDPSWTSELVKG